MTTVETAAFGGGEIVEADNGKFRVVVITERCKECGICISVCPTKVLVKGPRANSRGYRYPIPEHIEKCIGCKMCEWSCPDFAIYVERVGGR